MSYQQIYSWVRKYEEGGVDKLKDNRGRSKPIEEMSEVEKLKAEMKILEAENRQLEIEISKHLNCYGDAACIQIRVICQKPAVV